MVETLFSVGNVYVIVLLFNSTSVFAGAINVVVAAAVVLVAGMVISVVILKFDAMVIIVDVPLAAEFNITSPVLVMR